MLWYLTVVLICKFVIIYDVEHFSYAYLRPVYLVLVRYPDFCLFFLIGLFYYFDFKSCFLCFLDNLKGAAKIIILSLSRCSFLVSNGREVRGKY